MNFPQGAALATNSPKPGKKYFSLEEANRSLVYIRPIAREMCARYEQVMEMRRGLDHCHAGERERLEADLERGMEQLGELVDELNYVGVEIKDFEKAFIDFPAIHQSREIYFSWHLGEQIIQTWHEIDTGFAGRQDIALLQHAA